MYTPALLETLLTNQLHPGAAPRSGLHPSLMSILDAGVHVHLESITGRVPSFLGPEISHVPRGKDLIVSFLTGT